MNPSPANIDRLRTPEVLECAQRLREFKAILANTNFSEDIAGWSQVNASVITAERLLDEAITKAIKDEARAFDTRAVDR